MVKIKEIYAYHQFDSRGFPTIAVRITSSNGNVAKAMVPSGASTGKKEAIELRDKKKDEFFGKSVFKAIENVNEIIAPKLINKDVFDQENIDWTMIQLDGTKNKSKLGANAILSVSLAVAKLAAIEKNIELYEYIYKYLLKNSDFKFTPPQIMVNVINGGAHANNNLDFQEFMIVPKKTSIFNQTKMASEVFYSLGQILKDEKLPTGKGDEGGYDTKVKSIDDTFNFLSKAIKKANYKVGKDIFYALDVAASEFYENGKYEFRDVQKRKLNTDQMIRFYIDLVSKYPIISIEDPLDEADFIGFGALNKALKSIQIVGDDLYCTNKTLLQKGIDNKSTSAILIKLNQIGTLTETLETISLAKNNKQKIIISHRSGETEDTTIADLAAATNAEFIKTGSFSRSERLAKYNRLLEIENLESRKK